MVRRYMYDERVYIMIKKYRTNYSYGMDAIKGLRISMLFCSFTSSELKKKSFVIFTRVKEVTNNLLLYGIFEVAVDSQYFWNQFLFSNWRYFNTVIEYLKEIYHHYERPSKQIIEQTLVFFHICIGFNL